MYPAKIILFGEYSIFYHSKVLAIPLFDYKGVVQNGSNDKFLEPLLGLHSYLSARNIDGAVDFLDLDKFLSEIKKGWVFSSDIPIGSGLGSSGALCAAVYDNFKTKDYKDHSILLKHLGVMESYFHSSSSGIDPFISLRKRPVCLDRGNIFIPENIESFLNIPELSLYLLNTKITRQASPFVKIFKHKVKDELFARKFNSSYVPVNDALIDSLIDEVDFIDFKKNLVLLSLLQIDLLKEMFLPSILEINKDLVANNEGCIKLCGAGGGGHYLLFSFCGDKILDNVKIKESMFELKKLKVSSFLGKL